MDPETPKKDDLVPNKQTTSPASSKGSEIHDNPDYFPPNQQDMLIHDNPDYIPPNQQDMLLTDVTSQILHTHISEELGVECLSKIDLNTEKQRAPLDGLLYGLNKRLMVNVVTRRMSRRKSTGPDYPSYNIIFLCDTGSPNTFICEEAMIALTKENSVKGYVTRHSDLTF